MTIATPYVRTFPSTDPRYSTLTANGRRYVGVPGTPVDVPYDDAGLLEGNGWISVARSGPSSQRPADSLGRDMVAAGLHYFDTTVGALIVFDGMTWRSPVDGSAV